MITIIIITIAVVSPICVYFVSIVVDCAHLPTMSGMLCGFVCVTLSHGAQSTSDIHQVTGTPCHNLSSNLQERYLGHLGHHLVGRHSTEAPLPSSGPVGHGAAEPPALRVCGKHDDAERPAAGALRGEGKW